MMNKKRGSPTPEVSASYGLIRDGSTSRPGAFLQGTLSRIFAMQIL